MSDEGAELPEGFDPTRSTELVRQSKRGDPGAANELFTRYIPRLSRLLKVMIAPGQRASIDPEDVLQETLMVAARRLHELEVRSSDAILCWLKRIAELEVKNRLQYLHAQKRDPARERRNEGSTDSTPGLAVPSYDPTPSQVYAREEMERIVDRELHLLEPPDYREVILLRDYCDADWEHIRVALERPSVAAVKDLYHRAHDRLRERLARFES
jgi:DNA-directed RNA polymerase specialized sigma24 family protein